MLVALGACVWVVDAEGVRIGVAVAEGARVAVGEGTLVDMADGIGVSVAVLVEGRFVAVGNRVGSIVGVGPPQFKLSRKEYVPLAGE